MLNAYLPEWLDAKVVYAVIAAYVFIALATSFLTSSSTAVKAAAAEEEEEVDPPRDFTPAQLLEFTGEEVVPRHGAAPEGEKEYKPLYIGCKGEVFDVSSGRDFYGPGASYHGFAGRDASRALAKMSLEPADVDNPDVSDLNHGERDQLDEWYFKFRHLKCYRVVGRVSTPDGTAETPYTFLELQVKGDGKAAIAENRVDAPLLIAVRGTVYDVSYGGKPHYGPGSPYHLFCGKDASRALAKMSFDKEDLEPNTMPPKSLEGLTSKSITILDDWEKLFKRKYPAVGRIL